MLRRLQRKLRQAIRTMMQMRRNGLLLMMREIIPLLQRISQCLLINSRATSNIDDPGVLWHESQAIRVECILGRVGSWEDHDEDVSLGKESRESILGEDFDAVANTGMTGYTLNFCAEESQARGEALCDISKAPHENFGIPQGREPVLWPIRLRAAR